MLGEFRLENRLHDVPQRALHHAVTHRRDAQRALLTAAGFGYPDPAGRVRLVGALAQLFGQPRQLGLGVRRKLPDGLPIRSRAAPVLPDRRAGALEIGRGIHFIH